MRGWLLFLYKSQRPIMDGQPDDTYISKEKVGLSKLQSLTLILHHNLQTQKKLKALLQSINHRKKELEEFGLGPPHKTPNILNSTWVQNSSIPPPALESQLSLKKSKAADFRFTRNIIVEPHMRKIKKTGLLDVAKLSKNPKFIDFFQEAEKCTNFENGLEVYKKWRECNFPKKQTKRNFSREEIVLLQSKKARYGDNWEKICTFFNGSTFEDLYYFYQKNLTNIKPGRWSLRENIILIILVECFGVGKWAAISKAMKCKSEFQVRERFCNILDPTIMSNKWEKDDAELLLKVAQDEKYLWSKIAKMQEFKGKTDNALRRKFRTLMCKYTQEEIRQIVKKRELADSIIEFKRKQVRSTKPKGEEKVKVKQEQ